MTELYINNKLCDLPSNLNFTLVSENLFFSDASDFTLDIELPITPLSNNARIFNNINRTDKSINTLTYNAKLIVDNKTILNGSATIVSISNNSITIQILQGRSELNYKNKLQTRYIDELSLGNISQWGFVRDNNNVIRIHNSLRSVSTKSSSYTEHYWQWDCIFKHTNGDVHVTPIINSSTGDIMNGLSPTNWYAKFENDENAELVKCPLALHDNKSYPTGLEPGNIWRPNRLAVQPKFKIIFQRIFSAAHLIIETNEIEGTDIFENLYIANSTEVWNIADMLPHISIVEFIEQIEALFNCVVLINNNHVQIIKKTNYYNPDNTPNIIEINKIIDEMNIDIDTETTLAKTDQSKIYNISYPDYGTDFLGHEFDSVKTITDQNQLSETPNPNVFAIGKYGHKYSSPHINGNEIDGYKIDVLRASEAESDEEFTLNLIPCITQLSDIDCSRVLFTGYGIGNNYVNLHLLVPESEGIVIESEEDEIQSILDNLDTLAEKEKLSKLSLGFIQHCQWKTIDVFGENNSVTYNYDILRSIYDGGGIGTNTYWEGFDTLRRSIQDYCMSLVNITDGRKNLYKTYLKDSPKIVTSKIYSFKFLYDKVVDTRCIFKIKNQLYACKEINYQITAKGFSPIVEGKFYKL